MLNEPYDTSSCRGDLRVLPPEHFRFQGSHVHSSASAHTLSKKCLIRFTLISRMVLGVGKSLKSDLSLKIVVPDFKLCTCTFRVIEQNMLSNISQATVGKKPTQKPTPTVA